MLICLLVSCLGGEWIGGLGAVSWAWRSRPQSRPLGGRCICSAQIGDPAQQRLLRFDQEVLLWTESDRVVAYSYLMWYGTVSSSVLHLTWIWPYLVRNWHVMSEKRKTIGNLVGMFILVVKNGKQITVVLWGTASAAVNFNTAQRHFGFLWQIVTNCCSAKFSHSNRNSQNQEFCVRSKKFVTLILLIQEFLLTFSIGIWAIESFVWDGKFSAWRFLSYSSWSCVLLFDKIASIGICAIWIFAWGEKMFATQILCNLYYH